MDAAATKSFAVAATVGAIVGVIVTIAFHLYSKKAVNATANTFFGVSSTQFMNRLMLAMLTMVTVIMAAMSFIVHDDAYIRENPMNFVLETILVSVIPAALFTLLEYFRTGKLTSSAAVWLVVMSVKFGMAHISFQMSGYYSGLFSSSK